MSSGFARRFIAGETMEETVEPVRALNSLGITASLDFLGENTSTESEAAAAADGYGKLLAFIDARRLDANISLKLTQLGLDIGDDLAYARLCDVLEQAQAFNQFVRIDMEGSAYTQRTLDLFERTWQRYKNVGVVVQSYLYRSDADIERLVALGARVRLVKGAYNEPAEIAYPAKRDVDASYVRLMHNLLANGPYPAIATHDEAILADCQRYAREHAIVFSRFEFQMLFGIRRDLQEALVREGCRMRVYVPFGTQWYRYMMRRLAERPANLWFVVRNLLKR